MFSSCMATLLANWVPEGDAAAGAVLCTKEAAEQGHRFRLRCASVLLDLVISSSDYYFLIRETI